MFSFCVLQKLRARGSKKCMRHWLQGPPIYRYLGPMHRGPAKHCMMAQRCCNLRIERHLCRDKGPYIHIPHHDAHKRGNRNPSWEARGTYCAMIYWRSQVYTKPVLARQATSSTSTFQRVRQGGCTSRRPACGSKWSLRLQSHRVHILSSNNVFTVILLDCMCVYQSDSREFQGYTRRCKVAQAASMPTIAAQLQQSVIYWPVRTAA